MKSIANLLTNPITSVILASLVLLSPFLLMKFKDKFSLSNMAISLGMLGTFIGIVSGLFLFDSSDITNSIPNLLNGLKTAFLTSIAGMLASLIVKVKPGIYGIKNITTNKSKNQEDLLNDIVSEIKKLNSNISGEEDTTLLTQLQKLRTGLMDKQDELNKSFKEFSEKMVNSNIDALAEAIEKVMGDFNTTVNDKLGETFDDFRKAVHNLNQWQSEYKNQIISQTENLQATEISFTKAVESMSDIQKSFEDILNIKEKFDDLLVNLNAQLKGSIDFASSMKELSTDLDGAGKMIKEEMKDITYGAANEMEKTMNKTLADFGSNLADISGKMAEDFRRIQQMLENKNN